LRPPLGAGNRQTQAEFQGEECGFDEHVDLVGAINIQSGGSSRTAWELNTAVTASALRDLVQSMSEYRDTTTRIVLHNHRRGTGATIKNVLGT
jgi:hypothetical protein